MIWINGASKSHKIFKLLMKTIEAQSFMVCKIELLK